MSIDEVIDRLKTKLDSAKHEYVASLELYMKQLTTQADARYCQGVYDGLERAWRETVMLKVEMEKRINQ